MKAILSVFLTVLIIGLSKGQALDSARIKNLLMGEWVDSVWIHGTDHSDSHHEFIFMTIDNKTISYKEITDLDVDQDDHQYPYRFSKQDCFNYGYSSKDSGTGYFLKVTNPPARIAPFDCYYIQVVNDKQLILKMDGVGRVEVETYKRVLK